MAQFAIITGDPSRFTVMDDLELSQKVFTEPQWIIPELLPVGLSIVAGRPKAGKSWLALNIAIAVSQGGLAFGTMPTVQSDVLYLALEDRSRRLQGRMKMVMEANSSSLTE